MHRILRKEQVLTIPNLLSAFRIALLPVIVWLYCFKANYRAAILMLLVSGLTDIVDGFIARKFNMVSDFGKIIDPFADKLTQCALLISIGIRHKVLLIPAALFLLKEPILALMGYKLIKEKDSVNSAKWYGKLNTVIIYSSILILILFPNIHKAVVTVIAVICIITMILSMIMYAVFYKNLLKAKE